MDDTAETLIYFLARAIEPIFRKAGIGAVIETFLFARFFLGVGYLDKIGAFVCLGVRIGTAFAIHFTSTNVVKEGRAQKGSIL